MLWCVLTRARQFHGRASFWINCCVTVATNTLPYPMPIWYINISRIWLPVKVQSSSVISEYHVFFFFFCQGCDTLVRGVGEVSNHGTVCGRKATRRGWLGREALVGTWHKVFCRRTSMRTLQFQRYLTCCWTTWDTTCESCVEHGLNYQHMTLLLFNSHACNVKRLLKEYKGRENVYVDVIFVCYKYL